MVSDAIVTVNFALGACKQMKSNHQPNIQTSLPSKPFHSQPQPTSDPSHVGADGNMSLCRFWIEVSATMVAINLRSEGRLTGGSVKKRLVFFFGGGCFWEEGHGKYVG